MITRRELLGCWVPFAAVAVAADARIVFERSSRVSTVYYDDRAGDLADAAAGQSLRLQRLPDDLSFVYHELCDLRPAAVAGVADARLLLPLEGLAVHAGYRIVFLGQHVESGSELAHTIAGPEETVRAFQLNLRVAGWRGALLDSMSRVTAAAAPVRTLHLQREASLASGDLGLFSWVLMRREGSSALNAPERLA